MQEYNILKEEISKTTEEESNLNLNVSKDTIIINANTVAQIKIPKINVEMPVLAHYNEELMKIAPTKYSGPSPNCIGNFVVIGHNYYDNTHFSNLNKLVYGDVVILTDTSKKVCKYEVYQKQIVASNDFSCIENIDSTKVYLTLVTCINGTKNRLVVKCVEKI